MILRNKKRLGEPLNMEDLSPEKKQKNEIEIKISRDMIERIISNKLREKEENEEEEELEYNNSFDSEKEDRLMDYLKKNDAKAYSNYSSVIEEIDRTEPSIIEILNTPLKIKDKVKIFQLYEIYKETEQPSEDALDLREKIRKMFKKAKEDYLEFSKIPQEDVLKLKEESKKMKLSQPVLDLKQEILSLDASLQNKSVIYKKFKEFQLLDGDDEASKLRNWLKWSVSIPHDKVKNTLLEKESISEILNRVSNELDKELYGMKKVKEQLLLFLNAKLQNAEMKGCNIGLIGVPGCGKTSIARCLSKCLDLPFQQISFGGVSDPEFLTGHDYTYIGSRPGEIVRCLQRMQYKNGIIFLDEFEKVAGKKGITSTLLHLTDFSQNHEFRDNYLADITLDLSRIWFIYSMNSLPEDTALRDRIFTINVDGYTSKEKVQIIQKYLLPKGLMNIGLKEGEIWINEENSLYLVNRIDRSGKEGGIRSIEKSIKDILNKIHFLVSNKDEDGKMKVQFQVTFDVKNVKRYPVEIDKDIINKFVDESKEGEAYLGMFI
jgi:ATP-dependent Lon protease